MIIKSLKSRVRLSLSVGVFPARSSFRLASTFSLLPKLFKTCNSCGVKLQNEDASKPGFYIEPQPRRKLIKDEDLVFNKVMSKLSTENKKLLLNDEDARDSDLDLLEKKVNVESGDIMKQVECIRCRDAKYRSKYKMEEYPIHSIDSVLSTIPPNGQIVYVINAQDFPFSIRHELFDYRKPHEVLFIINKVDLLFSKLELANKYGIKFFRDFLKRKYNVPPENVIVASGLENWNIKSVLSFFQDYSYFVGHVNSGKSTLIGSLLYYYEKHRPQHMSQREKTKLEKDQDKVINKRAPRSVLKQAKRDENLFRLKNAPGVSYMPGFTRDHIEYSVADKTIYDVPGFTNLTKHSTLEKTDHRVIKQISKGVNVAEKGYFYSPYETFKGGQCLTAGGLFYVKFPEGSMYQIRNCINIKLHKYSSYERACEVLENVDSNRALKDAFVVGSSTLTEVKQYIVPPFYGAVDLVIKNVGHINIIPTGSKSNNEPLIVYLPVGMEAIIRQPITKFISKSPTGRDSKGNPLRKENWASKSVMDLKHYTGTEPFYSVLIPNSPPQSDTYSHISEFVSRFKGVPVKYTTDTVLNEENRFDYWCDL